MLLLAALLTGRPMRGRCPKLLMLPLNTQLRTTVALLVGSGLVGADLGRVISLAPKALSTRLGVLTQRLSYVRGELGGTMQARHGQMAQGHYPRLSAGSRVPTCRHCLSIPATAAWVGGMHQFCSPPCLQGKM